MHRTAGATEVLVSLGASAWRIMHELRGEPEWTARHC